MAAQDEPVAGAHRQMALVAVAVNLTLLRPSGFDVVGIAGFNAVAGGLGVIFIVIFFAVEG